MWIFLVCQNKQKSSSAPLPAMPSCSQLNNCCLRSLLGAGIPAILIVICRNFLKSFESGICIEMQIYITLPIGVTLCGYSMCV